MTDTAAAELATQITPQITDEREFEVMTAPLRGELTAHCYRMLGSVQDAEDQVQETYLRAWRAYESFEGRSSVRTWMYRIATRTCLTAIEQRQRRPLPTGLGAPATDPGTAISSRPEIPWLEPLPDALVAHAGPGPADDPAATVITRDSVRLAFAAALQWLTGPQRAALILREVLAFSAAETAETLEISVASANSALQRARAKVASLAPADEADQSGESETGSLPVGELAAHERDLLGQYMRAIEEYDAAAVVRLVREDVVWEMPPFPEWFRGPVAVAHLVENECPAEAPGDLLMVPTAANGQPACAGYLRGEDGVHRPFQLVVLTVGHRDDWTPAITHVHCTFDVALFPKFGLPETVPHP